MNEQILDSDSVMNEDGGIGILIHLSNRNRLLIPSMDGIQIRYNRHVNIELLAAALINH